MEKIRLLMETQFSLMCNTGKLFRSDVTGDKLWTEYLNGFESDPIFRDPDSSTHNCNHCNNFIRRYGNIVAIEGLDNLMTIFDIELDRDNKYFHTFEKLSNLLKKSKIDTIFTETFDSLNSLPYESCNKRMEHFKLGVPTNHKIYTTEEADKFGVVTPGEVYKFDHFSLTLPKKFVDMTGASIESITGEFRERKKVFTRLMEEIPYDTLTLVYDLINQGSLMDGDTHINKLMAVINLKSEFDSLDSKREKELWLTQKCDTPYWRFKNELIGVLCSDLAQGVDLNKACMDWNKRVDPKNFMKAVAPITEKQKKDAQKYVVENGYTESFNRRYANIDDIKVSEIKHVNNETKTSSPATIFDKLPTKSTSTRHKKSEFEGIETVSIEKFMEKILPTCGSIEVYLENGHEGNMVTMTTSQSDDSKKMFKWDNNYSWTFNGNLAGKSQIKEQVKSKGGNVDGVVRFSLIWNDGESKTDNSDLDAWCVQPGGERIGFSTGFRKDSGNYFSSHGGQLDLDETGPGTRVGVENIYFPTKDRMVNGTYQFFVHQYADRNSQGFKVEVEVDGEVRTYEYRQRVTQGSRVNVVEITYKNGNFEINDILPSTLSDKDFYGLKTNSFHKVNLVCLSPNHWDGEGVGNKHYFFMLDGCINPNPLRTFHVENLNNELLGHRKVMEVLGSMATINPNGEKQLSGVGFNATVRDSVVLKLGGTHKRTIRVKF